MNNRKDEQKLPNESTYDYIQRLGKILAKKQEQYAKKYLGKK